MSANIQELTNTMKAKGTAQKSGAQSQADPTNTQEAPGRPAVTPQAKFIPTTGEVRMLIPPKLTPTASRQEDAAGKIQEDLGSGELESKSEDEGSKELDQSDDKESQSDMLMAKVLKADQARAKMYYAIYKALQNLSKRRRAPTPQEWYKEPKPEEYIKGEDSKKEKTPADPSVKESEKNAAIMHHAEKWSRLDELSTDRKHYTDYPYPREWTQSFSKWTVKHWEFYLNIKDIYNHNKMAQCGTTLVENISIMREKVWNTCFATAWRFNKLEFKDINQYAPGEAREDWDPTTGTKQQSKKAASNAKTPAHSQEQNRQR
ncbi:hypothetical protein PCASD_26697 [Puccinia coronata f. sp. avenae]|uniref:Uncharacterized protein n=1 Tax=Puccinia coronata f. sp. avenae TaxID=200324 RepID=A0A2N5TH54_9BASI|nr:hypothetical protein PCASD_26697 [Puccinia coronata f. sp. avenae]